MQIQHYCLRFMQFLSKIPSSSAIIHSTNNRKDFVNSRKMFLNYRLSPQGHFKFSMFTSCSPRKEKANQNRTRKTERRKNQTCSQIETN